MYFLNVCVYAYKKHRIWKICFVFIYFFSLHIIIRKYLFQFDRFSINVGISKDFEEFVHNVTKRFDDVGLFGHHYAISADLTIKSDEEMGFYSLERITTDKILCKQSINPLLDVIKQKFSDLEEFGKIDVLQITSTKLHFEAGIWKGFQYLFIYYETVYI